jgi:hypothetical protein
VHKKLFSGKKVEVQLKNISEVVSIKKNFLNALFGFGSILITPLSGTQKFRVLYLPHSDRLAEFITEFAAREKNPHPAKLTPDITPSPKNTGSLEHGSILSTMRALRGIEDVVELDYGEKDRIAEMESRDNRGIFEILRRKQVFCVLRKGKVDFPASCMVGLPSLKVHEYLSQKFSVVENENEIVLVGA